MIQVQVTEMTDGEDIQPLFRMACAGDSASRDAVLNMVSDRLTTIAQMIAKSVPGLDPIDLVQEAIAYLLEQPPERANNHPPPSLKGGGSLATEMEGVGALTDSPWKSPERLLGEATIRMRIAARREGGVRSLLVELRSGPVITTNYDATPEGLVILAEEKALLRRALGELPDRHRAILELSLTGATSSQIAGLLGIPVSIVSVRLRRARKVLITRLHETLQLAPRTELPQVLAPSRYLGEATSGKQFSDQRSVGAGRSVLISSIYQGFASERSAVLSAVITAGFHTIQVPMTSQDAITTADIGELVAKCDVFVAVHGGRFGSEYPGSTLSWSEAEFEEALKRRKRILVYEKTGELLEPRQRLFNARVRRTVSVRPFSTVEELRSKVEEDLRALDLVVEEGQDVQAYRTFVRSTCRPESFPGQLHADVSLRPSFESVFISRRVERQADSPATARPIALEDLLNFPKQISLVGEAGIGKTWALYRLASWAFDSGTHLPAFVRLAEFASEIRSSPERPGHRLPAFISENTTRRVGASAGEMILRSIEEGSALVLLDGLDEVAPDSQPELINEITRFVATHPTLPLVVTSRMATRLLDMPIYRLAPLASADIAAFVQSWFDAVTPITGMSTSRSQVDRCLRSILSHSSLAALAQNPLFLTCLVVLQREGLQLPQRRVEAYDAIAGILVDSWYRTTDSQRSPAFRPSREQSERLLCELALEMALAGMPYARMEDWQDAWRRIIGNRASSGESAIAAERSLAGAILVGLLNPQGDREFSFGHLSLQEIFAAKAIVRMNKQDTEEFLSGHFYHPRLQEVVRLALAWLDARSDDHELVSRVTERVLHG